MSGTTAVRNGLGGVLLVVAVLLAVGATALTYELTRMYGSSPNDDAADLTSAALGHALTSLIVAALTFAGLGLLRWLSPRRRLAWAAVAFLATLVALGVGMAAGQHVLNERCAGPERYSTGAC